MTDRLVVMPSQLSPADEVFEDSAFVVDNGTGLLKATASQIVTVGRPNADEAEAVTGLDNFKSMTPLRVRQSIATSPTATVAANAATAAAAAQSTAAAAGTAAAAAGTAAAAAGTAAATAQTTADNVRLEGVRSGAKAAVLAATQSGMMRRTDPTWQGDYVWDATVPGAVHTASPEIYLAPNPAADGAWVHQDGAPAPFFNNKAHRFGGRMKGGTSAATSVNTAGASGEVWSWLADTPSLPSGSRWLEANSAFCWGADYGLAVVGASMIKPTDGASRTAIGLTGCVWNRGLDPAYAARSWGIYGEAHHAPEAGKAAEHTHAGEVGIANYDADTATTNPFAAIPAGAKGFTINSGISLDNVANVFAVPYALRLAGLGDGKFWSGILIRNGAMKAWADTKARAMMMPTDHYISWWSDATTEVFAIDATATSGKTILRAADSSAQFLNGNGAPYFSAIRDANAAPNYPRVKSAAPGSPVEILAVSGGADTNVDLWLRPAGSGGRIRLGTAATPAGTPSNFSAARYIPIKDTNGTIYYLPLATAAW